MLITATEYAASHFNLNLLMQVITECGSQQLSMLPPILI